MKISQILRSDKTNVRWGNWTDDKIKKSDFPMSKKRRGVFPLTKKWRWSIISFDAIGCSFAVLAAYHKEAPEFQAILGQCVGNDSRVMLRWEYHGNHPQVGWHIHVNCEHAESIEAGIVKPLGQRRMPSAHSKHNRSHYAFGAESMGDSMAEEVVATRFGLPFTKDLFGAPVH